MAGPQILIAGIIIVFVIAFIITMLFVNSQTSKIIDANVKLAKIQNTLLSQNKTQTVLLEKLEEQTASQQRTLTDKQKVLDEQQGELDELYKRHGYCLNTLYSYQFEGAAGFAKMKEIMKDFQTAGITEFGGRKVETLLDYNTGIDGLPKENVLKFLLEGHGSVVVRPSGTEPKLKTYVTVSAPDKAAAEVIEKKIVEDLKKRING